MKTPIKALMMLALLNEDGLINEDDVIDIIIVAFHEGQQSNWNDKQKNKKKKNDENNKRGSI